MNDNYRLYKKLFNNVVISKIIFKNVQRYQDKDFIDYNQFNSINKSFRSSELTITRMLSNKLYGLFDDFIEFYFRVVINEPFKYWYYTITNNDKDSYSTGYSGLSRSDLYYLLSYKELGYTRFLKIYNHFKSDLIKHGSTILLDVAISGNLEIFNFLINQPSPSPFTIKQIPRNEIYRNVNDNSNSLQFIYSSGGNFNLFQKLFNHFKLHLEYKSNLEILICWSIENHLPQQYIFLLDVYKDRKLQFGFNHGDQNLVLLGLALHYGEIELVNYIFENNRMESIKELLFKSSISISIPLIPKDKKTVNSFPLISTFSIDFKTLYHCLKLLEIQDNFNQHGESKLIFKNLNCGQFLNFSFQTCENKVEWIEFSIIKKHYIPSLDEFKILNQNKQFDPIMVLVKMEYDTLILNDIIIHICNKSFDLEYLKYFLWFIECFKPRYSLPVQCLDTKFEIISTIFSNEWFKKLRLTITFIKEMDSYVNVNSFFGDIGTARFLIQYLTRDRNKLFQLDNGVLKQSLINGHLELSKFLIKVKSLSTNQIDSKLLFIYSKNNSSCNILKWLIYTKGKEYNPWNDQSLYIGYEKDEFLKSNLNFTHCIQQYSNSGLVINGNGGDRSGILDNFLIFKQIISNEKGKEILFSNSEYNYLLWFQQSTFKILDYSMCILNLKPTNLLSLLNCEKLIEILISTKSIKRLYFLIDNDRALIEVLKSISFNSNNMDSPVSQLLKSFLFINYNINIQFKLIEVTNEHNYNYNLFQDKVFNGFKSFFS